ncbi:MAG: hypothetical protein HOW73_26095 [Polyangiaceae bacterium]|nr:hypothetical protein [Polyangiaceae bacterium]
MSPRASAKFNYDDLSKLLLELPDLPYQPLRRELYSPSELLDGYDGALASTCDYRIYRHFSHNGRFEPTLGEALAQRLHDWSIDEALRAFIASRQKCIVAIMGGHSKTRDTVEYASVARLAWLLGRSGRLVASGGGPGIMEAANLGAFLSASDDPKCVEEALSILTPYPDYRESAYFDAARRVREQLGPGASSLAVPTWFYGHEPTNLFGTHIAKYFSNGIREDTLLAIAWGGVIYAPGKAGTWQEIFMDLAQNYYGTYPMLSPMIFFGRDHYEAETALYPIVAKLAAHSPYGEKVVERIRVADDPEEALRILDATPPHPIG